jgi:hypothetical protein
MRHSVVYQWLPVRGLSAVPLLLRPLRRVSCAKAERQAQAQRKAEAECTAQINVTLDAQMSAALTNSK